MSAASTPFAVSVDPDLVEAFHLHGDRPPPCLLIHGFTGTPYETRALGEALHAEGHSALGVRLAGHARPHEELERCGWRDWYREVEDGCTRLVSESGQSVVAIGVSAGALLALHLAHERPSDVRALVLIANAIRLRSWARWTLPLAARIPWLRFIPKSAGGSDIRDPEARRIHPSSQAIPVAGISSLLDLQRQVRAECPRIMQPTLLIHGAQDRTCPPGNVEMLSRLLGTRPRRTVILPDSAHIVTVDFDREQAISEVTRFVAGMA